MKTHLRGTHVEIPVLMLEHKCFPEVKRKFRKL